VHIVAGDLSSIEGSKALVAAAEGMLKPSSTSTSTSVSTTASTSSIDLLVLNHIVGMYEDWAARVSCLTHSLVLPLPFPFFVCSTNTPFIIFPSSYATPH